MSRRGFLVFLSPSCVVIIVLLLPLALVVGFAILFYCYRCIEVLAVYFFIHFTCSIMTVWSVVVRWTEMTSDSPFSPNPARWTGCSLRLYNTLLILFLRALNNWALSKFVCKPSLFQQTTVSIGVHFGDYFQVAGEVPPNQIHSQLKMFCIQLYTKYLVYSSTQNIWYTVVSKTIGIQVRKK